MPQRILATMWDFIAQQYRNSIENINSAQLEFRLSPEGYSVSETAWRALGACERWSAVLSGATTSEDAMERSAASVDLIQAASGQFRPGHFPESMPESADAIIERADDILATVAAQFSELGTSERSTLHATWWGASYTGDEIAARILWTLGYAEGQMHLLAETSGLGGQALDR